MASSNLKRKLEFDVSEIGEEIHSGALVHGRVIEMSPIKNSRKNKDIKYVEGQLTDGKEVCRFISFDVKIRDDIEKLMDREESVSLNNCGVKKNRTGDGYEVVLTKRSSVFSSPKKFKIDEDMMKKSSEMHMTVSNLEKLEHIEDVAGNAGNRVGIEGKLVSAKAVEEIKSKEIIYKKKECVISDCVSKAYRLVVWEDLVDKVEKGKCYSMTNVSVKAYQGQKYFSTTDMTEITEIDVELGEICENFDDGKLKFVGEVVGIVSFTEFAGCTVCAAKVDSVNEVIGICSKCGLKQKLARCRKNRATRLIIEDTDKKKWTVSMFSDIIDLLIRPGPNEEDEDDAVDEDIETKLLCSNVKEFVINSQNIVIALNDIEVA